MTDPRNLPDAKDVSIDYLIKPTPPSHEFRFSIRTLLLLTTVAAVIFGLLRLVYNL